MTIYVNWDDKKILSETEKDECIAKLFDDFVHNTDMMYDFLCDTDRNQLLTDLANGDDDAADKFRNSYKDYVMRQATEYFFEDYEKIEIRG